MTGGDTKALNKMMEAGQLDPNELLPKMAAYMEKMSETSGAYSKALGTSIVAQGRMNFQFEKFVGVFSKNGGEQGFAKIFNSLSESMRDNHDVAIRLGKAWEKLGILFEGVLNGLGSLSDKFGIAEGGLIGLAAAGLMMLNPFTRILMVFSGLMLIMEDLYGYSIGGDSVFGQWMEGLDGETFQVMKDFLADIQNLGDQTSIAIDKITTSFGKLIEALGESGVGGAVLRSTVSSLGFMVDHLTTLVTMAGMVAQGDMMGAAKVGASRGLDVINSFSRNAAGAIDLALPGTPLTGAMDSVNMLINQNTPQGKAWAASQAAQQRTSNWQNNRGSGADVPVVNNTFNISGVSDAEEVSRIVARKIEESTSNAIKNMPVTE